MIVIRAVNLIGDSLYSLKPIAEFHMQRPDEDVVIGVGGGLAAEMVQRQFQGIMRVAQIDAVSYPWEVIDLSAGKAADLASLKYLDGFGRRLHISECYAEMLGVDSSGWNEIGRASCKER